MKMTKYCLSCPASLACVSGVAFVYRSMGGNAAYVLCKLIEGFEALSLRDNALDDSLILRRFDTHEKEITLCPNMREYVLKKAGVDDPVGTAKAMTQCQSIRHRRASREG